VGFQAQEQLRTVLLTEWKAANGGVIAVLCIFSDFTAVHRYIRGRYSHSI
jgi:hypothetical protein